MTREESQGDEDEDDEEDDLDEYDEDLEGDDDEDDELTGITTVERLSSVEAWEMYRVVNQDTGLPIATIGIGAPGHEVKAVEYAVWRREDAEEPGATGSLIHSADHGDRPMEWDDQTREDVLRAVLSRHERNLGVQQEKADFRFEAPVGSDEGPEDEGNGDDEDPEDEG